MQVARAAAALAVPPPPIFAPRDVVRAPSEFVAFVEGDAQATARAIAASYGADACEIYKLGLYWGYSMSARNSLPGENNIYAVEIAHYARRRALPEEVWKPMVDSTPADMTVPDLIADTVRISNEMQAYLRASR
jgi:hypothetical protein